MYAEFTNDLITGNEMIDEQHKELIGRINDLLISCENTDDTGGREEVIKMLQYLINYTYYHFGAEESLQKEIDYPGYAEHVKKHDELRKAVADLQVILEQGDVFFDTFKEMVKNQVLDWLLYHINGFDRSVAEYKFMRGNPDRL